MTSSASEGITTTEPAKSGSRRFGIRNKLILLLLGFGLVPALAMYLMLMTETGSIRAAFDGRIEATAAQVNDVIDRNLFERYGDVQAFGLNAAAQDTGNWQNQFSNNPLVQAINGYTTGYGIYKLMLVLDLEGNVVSANTVNATGQPLDTSGLIGQNFKSETWFANAANGQFLEGRNGLTGTAVEQPSVNALVAELYGEDGYVIPFSAPIKNGAGETLGVWVNFADFGLVEEIVDSFYQTYAAKGEPFSNRISIVKSFFVWLLPWGHGSLRGRSIPPQHLVRSPGAARSTTGSDDKVTRPKAHPRSRLHPRPIGQASHSG